MKDLRNGNEAIIMILRDILRYSNHTLMTNSKRFFECGKVNYFHIHQLKSPLWVINSNHTECNFVSYIIRKISDNLN